LLKNVKASLILLKNVKASLKNVKANFWQIKTFGDGLAPPNPKPLNLKSTRKNHVNISWVPLQICLKQLLGSSFKCLSLT